MNAHERTTLQRMRETFERFPEAATVFSPAGRWSLEAAVQALRAVEEVLADPDHDRIIYQNARLREQIADYLARIHHLEAAIEQMVPVAKVETLETAVRQLTEELAAKPCLDFKPDHNGECLNCDEWADAHALPAFGIHQRLWLRVLEHPPTDQCPDAECMVCSMRDCPDHEPLHYHHDGCPCCSQREQPTMPAPAEGEQS